MARQYKAFAAIVTKALELGLPEHYKDDLFIHDYRTLLEQPYEDGKVFAGPVEFGWRIGPMGTHILDAARQDAASNMRYMGERGNFPDSHYFYWDGVTLEEMTANEVAQCLEATYAKWNGGEEPARIADHYIHAYVRQTAPTDDGDPADPDLEFAANQIDPAQDWH